MEVIKYGTKVESVIGGIIGIITAISIRESGFSYEVSYFVDSEYKSIYLCESEFVIRGKRNTQKIGFKNETT